VLRGLAAAAAARPAMGRSAAGRWRAGRGAAVPAGTGAGAPGEATRTRPAGAKGQERGSLSPPSRPSLLLSPSLPLQDLLETLGQLREEEGEPGLEDEPAAGAEEGGSEGELPGAESRPAEGQSQWRSLLSSYRRRHFSGCFGTRMERIGAQTGLGCNQYRARRCRAGARGAGRRGRSGQPLRDAERLPQQLSALLSQVSGGEGEAEAGTSSQVLSEPPGRCSAARQPGSLRSLSGGGVCSNKLLYKACVAFCECFFRSRHSTRSEDIEIPSRALLCLKGSVRPWPEHPTRSG